MYTPAAASKTVLDQSVIERVAQAIVRDIETPECGGCGVAGLLDGAASVRRAKDRPMRSSLAAQVVGAQVRPAHDIARVSLGEYAVMRKSLPAVRALATRAGTAALCSMVQRAITLGWVEGLRAVLAGDPRGRQARYWLPTALSQAMASPELLETVLTAPGVRDGGVTAVFAWTVVPAARVVFTEAAIAMAMSPEPEALWETVREHCPALARELTEVVESGSARERGDFFLMLGSFGQAHGYLSSAGLDFLARHLCRSRDCVGHLAGAWVLCGRRSEGDCAQAWVACCRRYPHVAKGFAAEAGTARYVGALCRILDEAVDERQAMTWVRTLAPLGGRTPVLDGRTASGAGAWLYAGWLAARGEAALTGQDVTAPRGRRRV